MTTSSAPSTKSSSSTRALSPDEIRAYYDYRAPYGTKHVPGTQDDFADLRVTETSAQIDGATDEHLIPHEILGPRPHSDTPCPQEYDSLDPAEIPHIADREGICAGLWGIGNWTGMCSIRAGMGTMES